MVDGGEEEDKTLRKLRGSEDESEPAMENRWESRAEVCEEEDRLVKGRPWGDGREAGKGI